MLIDTDSNGENKFEYVLWQKYWIGIYSEPIRTIPIHSDICI